MKINFGLPFLLCFLCFYELRAEKLNVTALGEILGYPPDQLVITDVSEIERRIYSVPTLSEAGPIIPPHLRTQPNANSNNVGGYKPIIPPENIIAAYRITGKVPNTFYPILVTIAAEGTFLSEAYVDIVEKIESIPYAEKQKEKLAHLGHLNVDGVGSGGVILGEVRVPSSTKEIRYPSSRTAMVAELRNPEQKVDIRIAIFTALDGKGGADLAKVPGGELYHGYFRMERGAFEEPWPEAKSFNWSGGIKAIYSIVHSSFISQKQAAHKICAEATAPDSFPRAPASTQKPKTPSPPSEKPTSSTPWSFIVVLIMVAIGLLWLVLKRRS